MKTDLQKQRAKETQKLLRETRLAQNICVQCGDFPICQRSKNLCDSCREKATKAAAKTKQNKIANGLCKDCGEQLDNHRQLCNLCYAKKDITDRNYRRQIKEQVITAYGGKCYCCGITNIGLLSIDHINGGGDKERAENGNGFEFYRFLLKQEIDFTKYQVLCYNCNCGRERNNGICPHRNSSINYSAHWLALKTKIVNHYGPGCYCCDERNIRLLTIDHINGNGKEHRRKIKGVGQYRWIIENNFPKDLRLSCYNCNCGRVAYGVCPHTINNGMPAVPGPPLLPTPGLC